MTTLVKQWSASRYRKFKPGAESINIEAQSYGIRERAQAGQVKLPPPGLERPTRRTSHEGRGSIKVSVMCCMHITREWASYFAG